MYAVVVARAVVGKGVDSVAIVGKGFGKGWDSVAAMARAVDSVTVMQGCGLCGCNGKVCMVWI